MVGKYPNIKSPKKIPININQFNINKIISVLSQFINFIVIMYHPFDPERAIDSMICFWKIINTVNTGIKEITEAAIIKG